ncbi:MAG: DMT family transporter [Pseudomonadota bacterium]
MTSLLLGFIAALAWGFHDFLVRYITQTVPISACILAVLVIGFGFQFSLTFATGRLVPMSNDAVLLSLAAGLCFVIANLGLYGSFQRGPVWLAAPLVACFAVFSVALSAATGATITPWQWFAVLMVLGGISIVSALSDDDQSDIPAKGKTVLYALISAVGFTGTFALGQAATELSNEMLSALATRLFAIAVMSAGIIAFRLPFWPGRKSLGILTLMGLADCIAILAIVSAGGKPNAEYTAVATSMYGLPAIWLAATFLNEKLNKRQWLGCLIAFAGVGYLAW